MFVKCGAWKSIFELEESLTLHEMFMLYRALSNDFTMNLKALAATQGADVDWEEDWYNPEPPKPPELLEQSDMRFIPIGLGYESE